MEKSEKIVSTLIQLVNELVDERVEERLLQKQKMLPVGVKEENKRKIKASYADVIELPQAWMAKDEAIIYFGYKLHRALFQKLLKEFKEHEKFKEGYRLPTSNMPTIDIQKFDEFLKWREKNKYKRNKE